MRFLVERCDLAIEEGEVALPLRVVRRARQERGDDRATGPQRGQGVRQVALAAMDGGIAADPSAYDAEIERNQRDLEAAGHWGVPTMVFEGEPFFGQDRLELLLWRLRQSGLRPRAGA